MRILAVLLVLAFGSSTAHAQLMESVFEDGFEFQALSYSYSFVTDQFVVAEGGRSYEFEVVVRQSNGSVVSAGDVAWTSTNPSLTVFTVLSPRRVRVAVNGSTGPGVVRITARHQDALTEANAQLIFETLQPWARFVSGNALVSANATSATFVANAQTNALVAGDVVMVGDSNALLVRINSIATVGAQRISQTTPAYVSDFFVQGAAPVVLESDPLPLRIDVRNGRFTYRDAAGRFLADGTLRSEAIICQTSGGGGVSVDVNKIIIDGTGVSDFSMWRVSYDWRDVALNVTGDWAAQVTILPGAISVNGNVGFACSLALPSLPVPAAGLTLYAAKVGLTIAPSLRIEADASASVSLLQDLEFHGRATGLFTAGLRWRPLGGWAPVGSIINPRATTELRRVGDTFATAAADINVRSYLRAEPELGVSAATFDTFSTRLAEIDLGGRMALQLQTPLDPQVFNYVGPSGDVSGLARARLKAPQILNDLIDLMRRAFPLVPLPPGDLELQLFDIEPVRLNWDAATLLVTPNVVTQACDAPWLDFQVSNLRQSASGLASAFARGKYRVFLYGPGNNLAPVWISPEQDFSSGVGQLSLPISEINGSDGSPLTGDLRAQVRASYAIAPTGDVQEPVTDLLPVRSSNVQSLRINPATLNCGTFNDTGQDWCADNKFTGTGNLPCPQTGFPRQDGDIGRDAQARLGQLTKVGAGDAGFDFTKISNSGNPLPTSATLGPGPNDWGCTRDNVTGLIWEVKVDNAGHLRHMQHSYTWYSVDGSVNGGVSGTLGTSATCNGTLSQCNTQAFVAAVNAQGLCGNADWRMPTIQELQGIVHHGRRMPAVDPTFFINTPLVSHFVWSGHSYPSDASKAWLFVEGATGGSFKSLDLGVRLVRAGK